MGYYLFESFPVQWLIEDDRYIPEEYMDEMWCATDYPNIYVSDYGRVYNGKTGNFLKPKPMDKHGHLGVMLRINGKDIYVYVHRLMAKAFIPNEETHPIVRHLDDKPWNNDLNNLAWGTMKDNHLDSVRNGNHKPFSPEAREKSYERARKPVIVTNLRTGERMYFRSIVDACRRLGVQPANAGKVLAGERSNSLGYFFEYAEGRNE